MCEFGDFSLYCTNRIKANAVISALFSLFDLYKNAAVDLYVHSYIIPHVPKQNSGLKKSFFAFYIMSCDEHIFDDR
jgi:hypothetical protein